MSTSPSSPVTGESSASPCEPLPTGRALRDAFNNALDVSKMKVPTTTDIASGAATARVEDDMDLVKRNVHDAKDRIGEMTMKMQ